MKIYIIFILGLALLLACTNSSGPVDDPVAQSPVLVSVGTTHSCAVKNNAVKCWGKNDSRQLGDGTTTNSAAPVASEFLSTDIRGISSGASFSCAIKLGGVTCWGLNTSGQQGNGSTASNILPSLVSSYNPGAVSTTGILSIASGTGHTCALIGGSTAGTVDGTVKCWGLGTSGQLGSGTATVASPVATGISTAQAMATGLTHSCAILNGGVKCWGLNTYGQLGDETTTTSSSPVNVTGATSGNGATLLAAGADHTCAVIRSTLKCWGRNNVGQLGDGTNTDRSIPTKVTGLSGQVSWLGAGNQITCAIISGSLWCWGNNASGQLGNGTTTNQTTPVQVSGLSGVSSAAPAIGTHSCAVVGDAVKCWGDNANSQLGDGTTTQSLVPVAVSGF